MHREPQISPPLTTDDGVISPEKALPFGVVTTTAIARVLKVYQLTVTVFEPQVPLAAPPSTRSPVSQLKSKEDPPGELRVPLTALTGVPAASTNVSVKGCAQMAAQVPQQADSPVSENSIIEMARKRACMRRAPCKPRATISAP